MNKYVRSHQPVTEIIRNNVIYFLISNSAMSCLEFYLRKHVVFRKEKFNMAMTCILARLYKKSFEFLTLDTGGFKIGNINCHFPFIHFV